MTNYPSFATDDALSQRVAFVHGQDRHHRWVVVAYPAMAEAIASGYSLDSIAVNHPDFEWSGERAIAYCRTREDAEACAAELRDLLAPVILAGRLSRATVAQAFAIADTWGIDYPLAHAR